MVAGQEAYSHAERRTLVPLMKRVLSQAVCDELHWMQMPTSIESLTWGTSLVFGESRGEKRLLSLLEISLEVLTCCWLWHLWLDPDSSEENVAEKEGTERYAVASLTRSRGLTLYHWMSGFEKDPTGYVELLAPDLLPWTVPA